MAVSSPRAKALALDILAASMAPLAPHYAPTECDFSYAIEKGNNVYHGKRDVLLDKQSFKRSYKNFPFMCD